MGYKFEQFMPKKVVEESKEDEDQIDSRDPQHQEIERMRIAVQNKHIVLDEWIIEPEPEAANISKMYLK